MVNFARKAGVIRKSGRIKRYKDLYILQSHKKQKKNKTKKQNKKKINKNKKK